MLRVLHIVTDMNRGGLETMIMNYYRCIDKSKLQFDFLEHRSEKSAYDEEIEKLGGKIYRIQRLNPMSLSYFKALDAFFEEHKYLIVHSHLDCMSAYPLRAAKKAGIPIRISHAHSTSQDKNWKYIIKIISKQFISKYATDLFACSKQAGKWMFSSENVRILKNAIDSKKYSFDENCRNKLREELNCVNDLVVGHVGRFSYPKNHDYLIDIFYELSRRCSDVKLILLGDGERLQEVKEKVSKLGIEDKIIFLGIKENVSEYLMAMDIFVFPSIYEGLGIAAIEAQATGIPCIVSDRLPAESTVIQELVVRKSIDLPAKEWAKEIVTIKKINRINRQSEIEKSGFDIVSAANELEDFYFEKKCQVDSIYTCV